MQLVESFLAFRRDFPDAVLKIIGDGPERPKIEAAAGDQLGRSVVLLGASYDEAATARHLLAADLFVMAGGSASRSITRLPMTCP